MQTQNLSDYASGLKQEIFVLIGLKVYSFKMENLKVACGPGSKGNYD